MAQDGISPDKFDRFIEKFDQFQSLVEEKKNLQAKIARMRDEFNETIRPLENELASIIRNLESNLSRLEGGSAQKAATSSRRFSRGQLGTAIKDLLRAHPAKAFKPREIADALGTKGTTISIWFNKYGAADNDIERIPTGKEGKRFLYKIR
ncbi:hypothetical protein [Chlorobium sp. N1]|uniref:hypothetical protein n=1 Tax=Chlorobium sp. N1 TaxID=2491138 RepID=UPI00103FC000|nr:hypothetical protein [Chlorobium sp. N1]TCD48858.1 hypothetical protein E0L29_02955 [Chlorobium sp. N1]